MQICTKNNIKIYVQKKKYIKYKKMNLLKIFIIHKVRGILMILKLN